MKKNSTHKTSLEYLDLIAQAIYDKKGLNILALDLRGISSITDYVVIAEGTVDRHVIALARAVMDTLSAEGLKPMHTEGLMVGDWVVLDYSFVIVHLFLPALRDTYHLEELWKEAEIVDLRILVN